MNIINYTPVDASSNTILSDSDFEDMEYYGRQTRLRSDLINAISFNQFRVHYQPVIDLHTNEIIAAEAFIRWDHPRFGILLPNEFITIAEESDFILEMGDWTLNQVCNDYSEWLREGLPPIKIAVNYSSIQFLKENFVDNVCAITKKHGLKPDFIIFEFSERVSIRNFCLVNNSIDKLHELGIQVSLDDFGTGFSSLEYLSKLKLDILKIDHLFTQSTPSNNTNAVIVESIVNLAQKLGIQAVAEGVETQEQLDFLKKINCNMGQGYYIHKPVPAEEFVSRLREKVCIPGKEEPPTINEQDKRKYFRLRFPLYLEASMTIIKEQGKDVHYGSTLVLIRDISAGGLCFYTTVNISVRNNLLIQFTTTLFGKQLVFFGVPIWAKKVKGHLYKCGVQFRISEEKKTLLDAFIHQLNVELDKDGGETSGDFVRQSAYSYFQV